MAFADPAAQRAYTREWKARNPERDRWNDKCFSAAKNANHRASLYGAPGVLTAADVRDCLSVGRCHYCDATDLLGIDHVVPLHAKGPNTRANIVPCCQPCNSSKWRQDRPGRWSREHDRCVECGGSDRPHSSHGLCEPCNARRRRRERGEVAWAAA